MTEGSSTNLPEHVDEQLRQLQAQQAATEGETFADLIGAAGADVVLGRTLIDKESLCPRDGAKTGTPFVITSITIRPAASELRREWVTCELTTADNVRAVFNDESTGIRRQVIDYLIRKGTLAAPRDWAADANIEDNGEALDSVVYCVDEPRVFDKHSDGTDVRLVCPRGLRVSRYTNEHGEGETFYIA